MNTLTEVFDTLVKERVSEAKAIAFDTCHKIYLLMDNEQVELMREYGYDPLITKEDASPDVMLATLQEWYEDSCGLRFIEAVSTNHENPNAGFETLIGQGDFAEDEEDEDTQKGATIIDLTYKPI
jgi:hypothetical protein